MLSRTASELFWMARLSRAGGELRPGAGRDLEIIDDPPSQPAVAGSGAAAEFVDDPRVVSRRAMPALP